MKKFLVLFMSVMMSCGLAMAKDHVEKIEVKALPEKAQQFVNDHLASYPVKKIICQTDERGVKIYVIQFKNKLKVEFDMVGAWNELDASKVKTVVLNDKMMPSNVRAALNTDFINKPIVKASNDGFIYVILFGDKSEAQINSLGTVVEK
ncbi:MAG: hypothetical protein J6Y77_07925 [Paludibacteraceae bacterium]|nr:hypothetical protein [Paludibacteraceae bacterium]